jgi:hypothetical protein
VKIEILELKSLFGETSVIISDYLSDWLTENGLIRKVVGLCADNTSSNFGGVQNKGQNSVFARLQKNLRHGVIRVGCAGHVFCNAVLAVTEILPVDVEMIIYKIYLYFMSYTVRVETLKEFCEFVEWVWDDVGFCSNEHCCLLLKGFLNRSCL